MPLYTAITQEGCVSDETKAKIAHDITRIHTSIAPVLHEYPLDLAYDRRMFLTQMAG